MQNLTKPKLVMCNIFSDMGRLKKFAHDHGFSGIDWSIEMESIPERPLEESRWVEQLSALEPLDVRYHCPFDRIDLGHDDPQEAKKAGNLFRRIIRLVSKAGGRYLTIHIGLGLDSTEPLSWDATIDNLKHLVQYGANYQIKVCLENLAWGWTSRPNLFEKLIRRSGAGVTFDIGHADACESTRSQLYTIEDFISPHPDRIMNAHIYHTEISGVGHLPPNNVVDIENRLSLLQEIGCEWWVIEIKEVEALLKTKRIIDEYLTQASKRSERMAKIV